MSTDTLPYVLPAVGVLVVGIVFSFFLRGKKAADNDSPETAATESVESKLRDLIFEYWWLGESGLERTVNWMRANAEPSKPFELTGQDMFLVDLVTLVRAVVLPKDCVRSSDALLLRDVMEPISPTGLSRPSLEHYKQLLENYRPKGNSGDWTVLTALRRREEPDLPRVVQIYMSIARGFADQPETARERRQVGLDAVLKHLEEFLHNPKAGIENIEASAEAEMGAIDHRYQILGAAPGCTLMSLKSSYRRTVALWHPDKLENMAPELKAQASEKMKAINSAFESLSLEFTREMAQPPSATKEP